ASIGFCFFKEYWGQRVLLELSQLGLAWFFKEAGISILYGTIADWNRVSARYARILGFTRVGTCPMFFLKDGTPIDIELTYLRREDFVGRSIRQHGEDPEAIDAV